MQSLFVYHDNKFDYIKLGRIKNNARKEIALQFYQEHPALTGENPKDIQPRPLFYAHIKGFRGSDIELRETEKNLHHKSLFTGMTFFMSSETNRKNKKDWPELFVISDNRTELIQAFCEIGDKVIQGLSADKIKDAFLPK